MDWATRPASRAQSQSGGGPGRPPTRTVRRRPSYSRRRTSARLGAAAARDAPASDRTSRTSRTSGTSGRAVRHAWTVAAGGGASGEERRGEDRGDRGGEEDRADPRREWPRARAWRGSSSGAGDRAVPPSCPGAACRCRSAPRGRPATGASPPRAASPHPPDPEPFPVAGRPRAAVGLVGHEVDPAPVLHHRGGPHLHPERPGHLLMAGGQAPLPVGAGTDVVVPADRGPLEAGPRG